MSSGAQSFSAVCTKTERKNILIFIDDFVSFSVLINLLIWSGFKIKMKIINCKHTHTHTLAAQTAALILTQRERDLSSCISVLKNPKIVIHFEVFDINCIFSAFKMIIVYIYYICEYEIYNFMTQEILSPLQVVRERRERKKCSRAADCIQISSSKIEYFNCRT